jgi:hypothetical protein
LFAHPDKCPQHVDADDNGLRAVQHRRCHDCAVLGDGAGQALGESQVDEVITICDHFGLFADNIFTLGCIRGKSFNQREDNL